MQHTNLRQSSVNASVWRTGRFIRSYDNRILSPAEVRIFVEHREALSGRVLDLGCGAGRVLAYLVMIGADAHGLDISPAMVEHCRRAIPEATVSVGDVASLANHVQGDFDAVIAPDNLLDVFSDAERRRALGEIREVLKPGGLLIFSSHDLAYADSPPTDAGRDQRVTLRKFIERTPADIGRSVTGRLLAIRNRRQLGPLQERHPDHAIINDFPHHYSLLHYYIRRDDQERQLSELGYELLECLDADGRLVGPGGTGPRDYLYYVAQRPQGS